VGKARVLVLTVILVCPARMSLYEEAAGCDRSPGVRRQQRENPAPPRPPPPATDRDDTTHLRRSYDTNFRAWIETVFNNGARPISQNRTSARRLTVPLLLLPALSF
jgi:hypothetical protein